MSATECGAKQTTPNQSKSLLSNMSAPLPCWTTYQRCPPALPLLPSRELILSWDPPPGEKTHAFYGWAAFIPRGWGHGGQNRDPHIPRHAAAQESTPTVGNRCPVTTQTHVSANSTRGQSTWKVKPRDLYVVFTFSMKSSDTEPREGLWEVRPYLVAMT